MSRQSFRTSKLFVTLAGIAALLTGCAMGGGMGGMLGGRSANGARPPYVEDEPKAKTQKPCPPQSQGTQDQATQDCKQPDHK
jgi:hypothetical protein